MKHPHRQAQHLQWFRGKAKVFQIAFQLVFNLAYQIERNAESEEPMYIPIKITIAKADPATNQGLRFYCPTGVGKLSVYYTQKNSFEECI